MKRLTPLGIAIIIALPIIFVVLFVLPNMSSVEFTENFTAPEGTEIIKHNRNFTYWEPQKFEAQVLIQNNQIQHANKTVAINNYEFTDGCLSMDWTGNSVYALMAIRVSDDFTKHYEFLQTNNNGDWLLSYIYNGGGETFASGNDSFEGTHNIKLCADGSTIEVYKDGSLLAKVTDTKIPAGGKQLCYAEHTTIDNVSVDSFDGIFSQITKLFR